MNLATLAETKAALIIDHDDDDATLELLIRAASEAVLSYIKADTLDPIPDRVKLATILLVNYLYRPTGDIGAFDGNRLPAPVLALLIPLRLPTVA